MLQVMVNGTVYEIPYSDGSYAVGDSIAVVDGSSVTIGDSWWEVYTDEDYDEEETKHKVNF